MIIRNAWCPLILVLVFARICPAAPPNNLVADVDYFERHIRPVLVENCYECHAGAADEVEAGLKLDTKAGLLRGGDSGKVVLPGNAKRSLLVWALRYDDRVAAMPPEKKLPEETALRFAEWIDRGAIMPDDEDPEAVDDPSDTELSFERVKANHWAFQLPVRATLTESGDNGSIDHEGGARLDAIVQQRLRSIGLKPAPIASREVLARRLHLDLVGLPPSYAWVESFKHDNSPSAFSQRVDELLSSPRFGERWARHWLDVARFADTKGYVFTASRDYPDAHKYRDWVIKAFNEDRPYDEFIRYQLAADQLAGDDGDELAAMGFLTLGRRFLGNQHDIIDDRIDVTTRGLMGLTVTCARCHDHKYDPIPAADYYSLYGVFNSSDEPSNAPSPLRLVDAAKPKEPYVFLRGKPGRRGAAVPRQFLAILSPEEREPFHHGSGRLEMANAIVSRNNPLTARVFVNRVWGELMGQYLVDTPSDFGTRCEPPVMQEVLDDLTLDFMERNWSMKWLVCEIVSSATYRQTSIVSDSATNLDPENLYFQHRRRKRLDFEAMRDSLLSVSGRLDLSQIGGPSIDVTVNEPTSRRTLYAKIDRQNFPSLFRTFDMASPDTHVPKRYETTVPQQALFLLNSPFIRSCADQLAANRDKDAAVVAQICELYRSVLARDPIDWELEAAKRYLEQRGTQSTAERWSDLAQVLLISNEFFFLD